MRIGMECGEKWYRLHSWYCRFPNHYYCSNYNKRHIRRFRGGVAVGPIMVVRGKW